MFSKSVLLLIFLFLTAAQAQQCPDVCRETFAESQRDCTSNSFVTENCESRPCSSLSDSNSFRCTRRTRQRVCPRLCYPLKGIANLHCALFRPRCQVSGCHFNAFGLRNGYQCGDAPIDSLDPNFSEDSEDSQDAFSSPEATDDATTQFSINTFLDGFLSGSSEDVPSKLEGDPRTFSVSYNLTINDGGLVSMNGVADIVDSIDCFKNATVRIRMDSSISFASAQDMYPLGAVLIIDGSLFGECLIEEPALAEDKRDEELQGGTDRTKKIRDAYLRIESVSGNAEDTFISGSATRFNGVFPEGEISVIPNDLNPVRMALTTSGEVTTYKIALKKHTLNLFEVEVEGSITDSGGFRKLSCKWNTAEIDIRLQLSYELIASVQFKAKLKIGIDNPQEKLFSLLRQQLYGIPDIKIIAELAEKLSLPLIKLGIFLEAPLIVSTSAEIERELVSQALATFETGRKEITFFITGDYKKIDSGVRIENISESRSSFDFTPQLSGEDPYKINFKIFAGVIPQVVLSLPFFDGKVGVRAGVEATGQFTLPGMAFPPEKKGGIGVCDTCHLIRVKAEGKVEAAEVSGTLDVAIPVPFFKPIRLLKEDFSANIPGTPTITRPIGNACFIREFGDDTLLCGTDCCRKQEEFCVTSGAPPRKMCSRSPFPLDDSGTQLPGETATIDGPETSPNSPGFTASSYTDPHLRTFDGLSYSCQASGEFTFVRSEGANLEVQARFSGPAPKGTVQTGVVVASENRPTVEVSMASAASSLSDDISSCPVRMYVDGVRRSINSGTGQNNRATVSVRSSSIKIVLNNGVSVSFSIRKSASFGCFFNRFSLFLPETIVAAGPVLGLLGSPNRNLRDDWMTPSGKPVPIPKTMLGLLFKDAYEYCTANWCIKEQVNSLFTYTDGPSFADISMCDLPFGTPPDFSTASSDLRALCGEDSACLLDGLVGNIEDARAMLTVQAEIDLESTMAKEFQFNPPAIIVEDNFNVLITINLGRRRTAEARSVDRFNVHRVNSNTGEIGFLPIVELFDNGLALNSDEVAGDLIFSNMISLRPEFAGERFSFHAIPVIDRIADGKSPFVQTIMDGVRSYSRDASIEVTGADILSTKVRSITGLELVARYSWPEDKTDVHTSASFSDELVGFGCISTNNLQYMSYTSQNSLLRTKETVTVQVGEAWEDGDWTGSTTVVFRADRFTFGVLQDDGPATLRLVLRDASSKHELPNSGLAMVVEPGLHIGCPTKLVGTLEIRAVKDGFTLLLSPADS